MIIVVGGSGRKTGKSRAVESLIRACPQARWLAVKISGHTHGTSGWKFERQESPDPGTDTGRFLAAGALEAWWLRADAGRLSEAVPELRSLLDRFENVVIESNSVVEYLRPDFYLFVTGGEWKESAARMAGLAGARVVDNPAQAASELIRFAAGRLSRPAET